MLSARSAFSRALLLLFVLAVPIGAAASTAQFQVFLDTDNNTATGCTAIAGGTSIPGIEHVLLTTVETTATGSNVTAVTRQECSGSVLGAAIVVNATGWPVGTSGSSGNSEIETHLPLSALGGALPALQRLYFAGTTGSLSSVLTTQPNGNPILFPQPQGRRRAVNPGSSTGRRAITLDGEVGDWNGIQPLLAGGASATSSPITFQSIFAVVGDADLFFRFSVKLDNAPVALDDTYDGAQGGATNIFPPGVLSNDSSPGGEALTAILVSGPQHGTVTLNSDGGFAYLNDGSNSPVDSFTYKASNGILESNTATVTINIVLNTPPVANDDSYSVPHGGTLTVIPPGVLGNDTDADGDALTAILVSGPQHGTLTLNPDGSFTYTHDGSNSTTDGFNYRAFDGIASTQAHVTITIGPDAPPVAVADAYTVAEGGTLNVPAPGVFANDSDPDSPQALWSAALGTGPLHGALTLNANGSFVYVHDGSETTTDSFTYTLSDGILTSAPATVTITITPVNDAPVVNAATFSIPENSANGTAVGTVTFTDPDGGQTHTFAITAGNEGGAFAIDNAGNITVANSAALNFETTPTFSLTVTVTDNGSPVLSGSATIAVNLTDVNDAPAIANQTFGIPENSANGTTVGTVVASDEDAGQTITYAITAGNIGTAFAIDPNTGVITVNNSAALDFETQPSFALLVTVTDNAPTPASSTAVVTINLSDVNEAPVVNPATFTIPESSANGTAVGTVTFTDPDAGQTHTFAITGGNTGGAFAIDPGTGAITVANSAALDFETTPSFSLTVTVTDNGSPVLSGGATITVNLTNVNDAPVNSVPGAQSTFEDVPLVFSSGNGNLISVSDPDAGASPVQVTLTATNGTLTLSGTTGLLFTVGSGSGDATMTFTGAITDINAALAGMQFVPTLDYNGPASVAITTNDQGNTGSGGALSDTDTVDITVNAVNDLPVAVDDSYTVDGGATLNEPAPGVLGNDSDVDNVGITAVLVSGPAHATSFTLDSDGSFTYVNDGLGANSDSFTYTANDPFGPSNTATVTITVQNNDPPNVNPATFTIAENSANGTAVGTVTFTDAESATETYTFTITTGNTGTAFAIDNAGAITVANSTALDFETNSPFSLTVQVTDDGIPVQSGTATITVNLTDVNEAPVLTAGGGAIQTFTEGDASGAVVDGGISVSDPDGTSDTMSSGAVTITNLVDLGFETLTADTTGTLITATYAAPTLTLTGVDTQANYQQVLRSIRYSNSSENPTTTDRSISFKINDGSLDSNIVTATVHVVAVNDAPVFTVPGGQTFNEDTVRTFNAANSNQINVSDADSAADNITVTITTTHGNIHVPGAGVTVTNNDTHSVSIVGTVANIDSAINGLTYTPDSNFNGSDTIALHADDLGHNPAPAQTADASISITLSAVNDKPIYTGLAKTLTVQSQMKIVGQTGLLAGVTDPDAGDPGFSPQTLQVDPATIDLTACVGCVVTVIDPVAGTFDFEPPPGVGGGATRTFTYRVLDNGNPAPGVLSDPIAVTVTINGTVIWFVNSAAAPGGNGTLAHPFQTMAAADAVDASNQAIFLFGGSYTGITLNTTEALVGQAVTTAGFDTIFGITPPAGTIARPQTKFDNAGLSTPVVTTAITAPFQSTIRGFDSTATVNVTGNSVTASEVNINSGGTTALNVTSGGGSLVFGNITSTGGTSNIVLSAATGTISATSGSLSGSGAAGAGVKIDGGTANFTYPGTIQSTSGRLVDIGSATGIGASTVTFSGALGGTAAQSGLGVRVQNTTGGATVIFSGSQTLNTGGSPAVTLTNNGSSGGGTINFTGGSLAITTTSGGGFAATGGGTVTVQGAANTISTQTGTALNVANTTIGANNLEFLSISSNGATNGIILNTTGSIGGLKVKGNSAGFCGGQVSGFPATVSAPVPGDCTGGTIQASTGPGILLTSTSNVSLTRVRVTGGGDDGIRGSAVTGFSLISSFIENNGNVIGENGIDFGDGGGAYASGFIGMLGTSAITNSTVTGSLENNVLIRSKDTPPVEAQPLSLTVTGSTFTNNSAANGSDGIQFESAESSNMTINVSGSAFIANRGDHFQASALNTGVLNATFTANTLNGGNAGALGQGITIFPATGVPGYAGSVTYDINGNSINGATSNAIIANLGTSSSVATMNGKIRNNTIGTGGVPLSCSSQANGIEVDAHGNGTHTLSITGNTIKQCFDRGILVLANDGSGALNMTVTGNVINSMTDTNGATGTPREAFNMVVGAADPNIFGVPDAHGVCLTLTSTAGNMVGGAFKNGDIRVRQRFRTSVTLPGYIPPGGNHFDTASVITKLQTDNPGTTATATTNDDPGTTTDGYFGGSPCPTPP